MPSSPTEKKRPITVQCREDLTNARRIVVKVGSAIVTKGGDAKGGGAIALGRLAYIVEQIAELCNEGKQLILVSSGSITFGRHKMRQQASLLGGKCAQREWGNRPCAAAGQNALMALYESMFSQYDVQTAQVLISGLGSGSGPLCETLMDLMDVGMLPIVNENDVLTEEDLSVMDNDMVASHIGGMVHADLVIILTNVNGVFNLSPTDPKSRRIPEWTSGTTFKAGSMSNVGRGGIESKVNSALNALEKVGAVVIASGMDHASISRCCAGESVGTLFSKDLHPVSTAHDVIQNAKNAARALQRLTVEQRQKLLLLIGEKLKANQEKIMSANKADLEAADVLKIDSSLMNRLALTEKTLGDLCSGAEHLAKQGDPLGRVLARRELSPGLVLHQESASLGVLLIIVESRPDVLPQVCMLTLFTGNALLLKGGKECSNCNAALDAAIKEAIAKLGEGLPAEVAKPLQHAVQLVPSRDAVAQLLKVEEGIDLIIPRGSNTLVRGIQNSTRIPVLGHAAGQCNLYIDSECDEAKAIRVAVDSKIDYPAACNAVETLLINNSLKDSGVAKRVLDALREAKVELFRVPLVDDLNTEDEELLRGMKKAGSMEVEHGCLALSVRFVKDVEAAIAHIHEHGSAHTEGIVTENMQTAHRFIHGVDSACIFHNTSTRFADGRRFGLGAEVGISTHKIHARGPVGAEGLLSTRWKLSSSADSGHTVADLKSGITALTHVELTEPDAVKSAESGTVFNC